MAFVLVLLLLLYCCWYSYAFDYYLYYCTTVQYYRVQRQFWPGSNPKQAPPPPATTTQQPYRNAQDKLRALHVRPVDLRSSRARLFWSGTIILLLLYCMLRKENKRAGYITTLRKRVSSQQEAVNTQAFWRPPLFKAIKDIQYLGRGSSVCILAG